MKVGSIYSRKDFEYTVVAAVKHKNKDGFVYLIEQRKFGEEEVEYFTTESQFGSGFDFEGYVEEEETKEDTSIVSGFSIYHEITEDMRKLKGSDRALEVMRESGLSETQQYLFTKTLKDEIEKKISNCHVKRYKLVN